MQLSVNHLCFGGQSYVLVADGGEVYLFILLFFGFYLPRLYFGARCEPDSIFRDGFLILPLFTRRDFQVEGVKTVTVDLVTRA